MSVNVSHPSQVFTFIYLGEMLVKIVALDPYEYFRVRLLTTRQWVSRCRLLPR